MRHISDMAALVQDIDPISRPVAEVWAGPDVVRTPGNYFDLGSCTAGHADQAPQ